MNDQPLTDVFVWEQYGPFFELLVTCLFVAIAVHVVAMLVLIFCLCREATWAGRKNVVTDECMPPEAGAPAEKLNMEHPTWNVEPARLSPEPRLAALARTFHTLTNQPQPCALGRPKKPLRV